MDHDQLVEEMTTIDRLTTAERLRLARKRRGQQLKRWTQREREHTLKKKALGLPTDQEMSTNRVRFVPAVMLMEAAARNDVDEVRRLLELGISADSTNEDGLTALHQCCIDDSEEMMKVLVEFGGDVNAADSEQWTPLHAASTCGHLHLVKFLIENGASLLAVNGDGNMPYDICEDETTLSFIENEMAKRGVTQELIDSTRAETENLMLADLVNLSEKGEDLEFRDEHGATPLHVASANGYIHVLEFLMDNHCSTEVTDHDQWQPLHAAACWGHLEAVEILAQNGADISALTKAGETPFDITEDPDIKDRLVELAEQRLRLAEPRLKKGRSSSTRTHSIRRTSLRDKMKTTKKDVAEEGLIYMKSVTKPSRSETSPEATGSAAAEHQPSVDVVDVADIQLSIPSSYSSLPPVKPVQFVPPLPKSTAASGGDGYVDGGAANNGATYQQAPPVRPARADRKATGGISTPTGSIGVGEQQSPSITASILPAATASAATSNLWSNSTSSEPINIHVSVTINPPGVVQSQPGQSNFSSSSGTLADLKRSRSQNRVVGGAVSSGSGGVLSGSAAGGSLGSAGSNTSSSVSLSSNPDPPEVCLKPQLDHRDVVAKSAPVTNKSNSPTSARKKFAASSVEVVGPPGKSGCCQIL